MIGRGGRYLIIRLSSDANVKLLAFLPGTGQAYFESFLEPAFELGYTNGKQGASLL